MKKLGLLIAGIFTLSTICFAQHQLIGLERAKEIRPIQFDREAVRKLLHDLELDHSSDNSDDFSTADASIEVFYSSGSCDEDEDEIWDAPKGKVVRVEIVPGDELKLQSFALDLATFEQERRHANIEGALIYHNKSKGIAVEVYDDEVERFILFPPVDKATKECKHKPAREFVAGKSWFGSKPLEERTRGCINLMANVTELVLEREELSALSSKEIAVSTTAVDPENDVLTYNYFVSAGKIIGTGSKVVWNLTGVGSGTYTITAGVDDGCGICGQTKTKTVILK